MASSPIRINEATADELQTLKGIGPKRAEHICQYRDQVALIRNTFDLAAATGISLKAAEQLAARISWDTTTTPNYLFWPVLLTALASVWLIVLGFNELANEPFEPPAGYYNLGLALVLLGGFAATGDIAIASLRQRPSETSWVFTLAIALTLGGLIILGCLMISSRFLDFSQPFNRTLEQTTLFISYCLMIAWQMYAPVLMIRLFIGDKSIQRLEQATRLYDVSLLVLPLFAISILYWHNTSGWLEEIFAAWCFVVAMIAVQAWLNAGTAFLTMLTEEDQGRLRFTYLRQKAN